MSTSKRSLILSTLVVVAALHTGARADDEGVYGPAAPPDSAFLRVFNGTAQPEIDAHVADKTLDDITAYGASEFVFLPPGQYTLSAAGVNQPITLKSGRYYTAALDGKAFKLIDNDRYSNHLKALLIVYNLVDGSSMSVRTGDGRPVVDKIAPSSFGSREVNAVKVNLALFDGGKKVTDVKPITLERGRVFSLFIAGNRDTPVAAWVTN
jgi:alginate O-acetyltransferase complex protein AlgF